MNSGVSRFPFLRLPEDVQKKTVGQMTMLEILNFSLSSKQTKSTVRKLELDIHGIDVHINERIEINAAGNDDAVLTFYGLNDMALKFHCLLDVPTWSGSSQFVTNSGFRFEQWLNHLLYIFNQRQIRKIVFDGVPCIKRLLNFRRTFDKFHTLLISARCPDDVAKNVLSKFRPEDTLWIDKYVPDIENYITLNFNTIHMKTILELDQLLIMNSKYIRIRTPKFSSRDMNRFLKLWIAGSNRNLEMLHIKFEIPTDSEMNQVVKGISHKKVPDDVRRAFPDSRHKGVSWIVTGGFDIRRRRDGAIATIQYVEDSVFYVYVWPS